MVLQPMAYLTFYQSDTHYNENTTNMEMDQWTLWRCTNLGWSTDSTDRDLHHYWCFHTIIPTIDGKYCTRQYMQVSTLSSPIQGCPREKEEALHFKWSGTPRKQWGTLHSRLAEPQEASGHELCSPPNTWRSCSVVCDCNLACRTYYYTP